MLTPSWSCFVGGGCGDAAEVAVFEPVGVAFEGDDVGVVDEPVDHGGGESAQLYRRDGNERVCIAAAERATGLRTTVALGARLPMTAGSGAQVLAAWAGEDAVPPGARFGARTLAEVRRRGWAYSVAQREAGVASVSAPVWDRSGEVVAAISVSGPVERLGRRPGPRFAPLVTAAAASLTARL